MILFLREAMTARNILRSSHIVSVLTALSRVMGLLREMLMAYLFGTTLFKTAFDVAFQIPNLFRNLLGEGALSAAFVPVFSESIEKDGPEAAHRLAGRVMTLLATVLAVIVLVGMVLITGAIEFLSLGPKAATVLPLLRIMLPYTFFICLVALCMAILNSYHRFALAASTPVLMNVAMILTLVLVCPWYGDSPIDRIPVVAWGVVGAGALQFLFQIPALTKVGFRPTVSFLWKDEKVKRVLHLMGPVALGLGVFQINVVVDNLLALMAAPWAPAALIYAQRLIYLPLGLFGTAMATVLLPTFAGHAAKNENEAILSTVSMALRNLILMMVPASVGLLVLSEPIVRLVFAWKGGQFAEESTFLTARAVAFYAPGLVFFSLYKVFVPAFYALKDTRTPVRVGVAMVVLNFVLNVLSVLFLPLYYKHAGLAFSTVVASAVNCLCLGHILHRRLGSPGWTLIAQTAGKVLGASLVMGVVVFQSHAWLDKVVREAGVGSKPGQLLAVPGSIGIGLAVYGILALLLCRREMRELMGLRHRSVSAGDVGHSV